MLADGIILESSLRFNRSRTCSAIYHLISGRKSIQTVQDSHIYQLRNLYGINRSLHKHDYDKKVAAMVSDQLLELHESMGCLVTSKGIAWLKEHNKSLKLHEFNGIMYHTSSPIFHDRLLLLIQTMSNSCNNYYSFIPINDKTPIMRWVKTIFQQLNHQRESFFQQLYKELYQLMDSFSDEEASMYVDHLSGYHHYGKSTDQLAHDYDKEKIDIPFILERMNHSLLGNIYRDPARFPALKMLLKDLRNNQFITNSAKQTFQLLKENYSIEDIGQIRKLKENTVYDHIVEVALFTDNFPIIEYVSEQEHSQIMAAIKSENTYKLKAIKEMIDRDISYFQIRLVLATMQDAGDQHE
ncbi:helix-turn-helix domain-containing protein [Virgibacillus phasianinus]|nr:helix-turn-helix domain-containing protein [Virgibacillus phasianinus]